jgi:hypothetical protein
MSVASGAGAYCQGVVVPYAWIERSASVISSPP